MNKQRCMMRKCKCEYTHIVAEFPWLVCRKHRKGKTVMCKRYLTVTEKEIADAYA